MKSSMGLSMFSINPPGVVGQVALREPVYHPWKAIRAFVVVAQALAQGEAFRNAA
jgi:hypothetical protein